MDNFARPAVLQGFVRKPRLIVAFSILYFLLPFLNVSALYWTGELGPTDFLIALYKGAFFYFHPMILTAFLLWLTGPIIAIGLYRVRLWAWYLMLVHAGGTLFYSYFRFATGEVHFSAAAFINVLVLLPAVVFLRREIRRPYFYPRLRWWEQHPRLRERLRVRLSWNEYVFSEATYDLSPDGIFVETKNLNDVAVGYFFNILLEFEDRDAARAPIRIQGIVVWISFEANTNPSGYGIKFLGLANSERKRISEFIKAGLRSNPERKSDKLRTRF